MQSANTAADPIHKWFRTDSTLNKLFPGSIQSLANRHWTPLHIIQMVTPFLVTHPGVKVLDIGSGVGKFCLGGAYYKPYASFFGVEQREHLITHGENECPGEQELSLIAVGAMRSRHLTRWLKSISMTC